MFKKILSVMLVAVLASMAWMASAQNQTASGVVKDAAGPVVGAGVVVAGTNNGTVTGMDGSFTLNKVPVGATIEVSFFGYQTQSYVFDGSRVIITLEESTEMMEESVVTAFGIRRDRKALGYAITEVKSDELMLNKNTNAINTLAGKVAGVSITQSSGSAGSGAQITLRGGTSLERDNQPLFVVDGIIYDNSAGVLGDSGFDGSMNTATTTSNRVMDINPEDIESMSILKGPAAAALYGSRASAGVVIINTKKGKEGTVEANFSSKFTASWVTRLPETQHAYGQGYLEDLYDDVTKEYKGTSYNDFSYASWGRPMPDGTQYYDNIGNFFQGGHSFDNNFSVSGGTQSGNFFLSASHFNQTGVIPTTGYRKTTFRFNGEQKWSIFTFTVNTAYSQAHTDKTLTSAGLYGNNGAGTMNSIYTWAPTNDMSHYLNEDGTRYSMFESRLSPWEDKSNPYWVLNKNKMQDDTERFTGTLNVKADLAPWWWIGARVGIDSYTNGDSTLLAAGGVNQKIWQNGMYSENYKRYQFLSTNIMSNMSKSFGPVNLNLLLGTATDQTSSVTDSRMAWNFQVPDFYAFDNAVNDERNFRNYKSLKRIVGVYGEFRADWKNTLFLTVTGRNDWSSTLPKNNRSYFYPSVSGAFVFTQLLQDLGVMDDTVFSFGKLRASWARVGKDTSPYATDTNLWPVGLYLGDKVAVGDYWFAGNAFLMPEITQSTELGLELSFFRNRLHVDYAFYTNDSYNQIMCPRLSNTVGYIERQVNAGDVLNKGMELSVSGYPVDTRDFSWETALNVYGNRGKVQNLLEGVDILYVTDVQVGNAKAASFNGGNFMAISGSKWDRTDDGRVILDKNLMPSSDGKKTYEIGNREPIMAGGWNNTIRYKNFLFNMLWDFRLGGDVYNGTLYEMVAAGTAKMTENRNELTITGVQPDQVDDQGKVISYKDVSQTFKAGQVYDYNGKKVSGEYVISNYWQNIYTQECANFMTKVNSLRLRNISLSYSLPQKFLKSATRDFVKACVLTASANNILLFTNYYGDPEVAAAGAGSIGSSSVGIDWCCVPALAGVNFGINVTFGGGSRKGASTAAAPSGAAVREIIREVEKIVEKEVVKEKEVIKEVVKEVPVSSLKGAYTDDMYFLIGQAELRPDEAFKLGPIAQIMKENPEAKITITGYADSATGNAEINDQLAAQRSAVVVDMLQKAGISADRIVSQSTGSDKDSNLAPESNRVVVCVIK